MSQNSDGQSIAGAETDAIRANLDIEFVNLIGREPLAPVMGVIGRPRLRTGRIDATMNGPGLPGAVIRVVFALGVAGAEFRPQRRARFLKSRVRV